LKHQLSGFWSRRIDAQHRLVYAYEDNTVLIAHIIKSFINPASNCVKNQAKPAKSGCHTD